MIIIATSILNGILIANLCLTKITSSCPYVLIFINTLSHTFSFSWQAIAGRLLVFALVSLFPPALLVSSSDHCIEESSSSAKQKDNQLSDFPFLGL